MYLPAYKAQLSSDILMRSGDEETDDPLPAIADSIACSDYLPSLAHWVSALRRIQALDLDIILPTRGPAIAHCKAAAAYAAAAAIRQRCGGTRHASGTTNSSAALRWTAAITASSRLLRASPDTTPVACFAFAPSGKKTNDAPAGAAGSARRRLFRIFRYFFFETSLAAMAPSAYT